VSERGAWLQAKAAGWDLLIAAQDLREVVEPSPVSPIPGGPRGIQGVASYQGEFLPVLAWEVLPGGRPALQEPVAMAVLKPRLGLPLERIEGTLDPPPEAWREPEEGVDPSWCGGVCRMEGQVLHALDPDRLIALLHRFREVR
jgi:chemotaxis signal transduction protein